jgi:hypothetical protein
MWVSAAAMLDTVPEQICKKLPQKQGAEQRGGPQASSDRRELLRERGRVRGQACRNLLSRADATTRRNSPNGSRKAT